MNRLSRVLLFTIFFFPIISYYPSSAQVHDDLFLEKPDLLPLWTFWIPGGTHFHQDRIKEGIIFSSLEAGLVTTGIIYDEELKEYSNSPYYNYPLYLGLNLFAIDKLDFARSNLNYMKSQRPDFKFDPVPFNDLLKEPFKLKNIITPLTGSFVALAFIELFIESRQAEFSIRRVDQMHLLNTYLPKDRALPIFALTSLGMSWEAGVGEEYWMRNYLMPVLDYRMGQTKGLLMTSGIFGGMHAFNYLLVEDPDPLQILYHVGFATMIGYILGKNVQHNNYKIGKAVAAHTWYDFTLMMGSFLVNPEENVFGVDVKLKW